MYVNAVSHYLMVTDAEQHLTDVQCFCCVLAMFGGQATMQTKVILHISKLTGLLVDFIF